MIFEIQRSGCQDFLFNGVTVERQDLFRYLGFVFHATKSMAHGVDYLVAPVKKAVHTIMILSV